MPGLKFHSSNQLESLVQQLAKQLQAPLSSPLEQEVIVTQSRGMARWISFRLAQLSGICMNVEFPFPRTFVSRTLAQFFPSALPDNEFGPEVLVWRILGLLPSFAGRKEFAIVNHYLAHDDGMKAFQLAGKVAHLFDQYLVYRPEMLIQWERDRSLTDWQALLWRALVGERRPLHLAAVLDQLGAAMAVRPPGAILPERVSIFGISSLPPAHLRIFFELSRHCEVRFYSLNPSQEYFGHDLSPKLKAKQLQKLAQSGQPMAADDLPSGNPLLASLGRLNRDQIEVRMELDEAAGFICEEEPEQFFEPPGACLLHAVQSDILHARNRGVGEELQMEVAASDHSITIHSCHSPMREVEVLYDQLLAFFEADQSLEARDILVMAPTIETYAPFIQAVFAYPEESKRLIPFNIADRTPSSESPIVETFLALLGLAGSRCTATEIFSMLERAPIRERFSFSDEDLETIRQWIVESGIRWGIDAAHRISFELPPFDGNTWQAGLNRLLLGYAMVGHNRLMFDGVMPHDEVEGSSAETLGRFIEAVEAMFKLARQLPKARLLADWPSALSEVLEVFFCEQTPEATNDLRLIRSAIEELRRAAGLAEVAQLIDFRVVRHHLIGLLDQGQQRGGFLTGGVTFCALQPMRSIPARIICLLGMDDMAFPRQAQAPEFDLMARTPKRGDRSIRDDDRYLFLELLISAREQLYLSYVGRSAADNEAIPPSVLISELLDYLDQGFTFASGERAGQALVTEHRLHAFSRDYFSGTALFSYSQANAAASASSPLSIPPPDFFARPLPAPDPDAQNVSLSALINFFSCPAKFFVRHRLGIRIDDEDESLNNLEAFALDSLTEYGLRQEMVLANLEQAPPALSQWVARGLLPQGQIGMAAFQALAREADEFHRKLQPELQPKAEPLILDLRLGPFNLTGSLESLYGVRLLHFRCSSIKAKDRVRLWISHLARSAADPTATAEAVLVGSDAIERFAPVPNALAILQTLLELYWSGLSKPLPFFPESSHAFAQAVRPPATVEAGLKAARAKWDGPYAYPGEKDAPHYQFCFKDDPLGDEFQTCAHAFFDPLLAHLLPV